MRGWKVTSVLLDGFTVGLVLLGINALFAPQDLGWIKTNPSPMLLLPVLIGCRYGFNAGIISGFAAGLPLLMHTNAWTIDGILAVVMDHGYFFSSLIILGGICGEIHFNLRANQLKIEKENQSQKSRMRLLNEETEFIRTVNSELERLLATRDSELSTLDSELRRLFDSEQEELYQDFLFLLNRQCRVSDAGVYSWKEEGESLTRTALIGNPLDLPEEIELEEKDMISLAAQRKTVVALPDQWAQSGKQVEDFLIVIPLLSSDDSITAFLVIKDMPFISFERSNIRLIHLISKWASRVMEIQSESEGVYRVVPEGLGQKLFFPDYFKKAVQLALESYRENRLPSSLVTFRIDGADKKEQALLESQVMKTMRNGDFPSALDLNVPNIAVLLPLASERGASIFMKRIVGICNHEPYLNGRVESRVISFNSETKLAELWNQLHALDQKQTV